jgi:hypothetical protein
MSREPESSSLVPGVTGKRSSTSKCLQEDRGAHDLLRLVQRQTALGAVVVAVLAAVVVLQVDLRTAAYL